MTTSEAVQNFWIRLMPVTLSYLFQAALDASRRLISSIRLSLRFFLTKNPEYDWGLIQLKKKISDNSLEGFDDIASYLNCQYGHFKRYSPTLKRQIVEKIFLQLVQSKKGNEALSLLEYSNSYQEKKEAMLDGRYDDNDTLLSISFRSNFYTAMCLCERLSKDPLSFFKAEQINFFKRISLASCPRIIYPSGLNNCEEFFKKKAQKLCRDYFSQDLYDSVIEKLKDEAIYRDSLQEDEPYERFPTPASPPVVIRPLGTASPFSFKGGSPFGIVKPIKLANSFSSVG